MRAGRRAGAPAAARRVVRAVAVSAALALGALTAGCSGTASADGPLIVVTTNILGDVVEELVGDEAEVMTLMPPGADPHSFEISAQEAARILDADLIVSNGFGLEEGLQQQVDAAAEAGVPVIAAGELIEPLAYSDGATDPHFWTDPQRMIDVVDGLGPALTAAGAAPGERATAYRAELVALDGELAEAFAAIPAERRVLVTNHHVFGYLAERYGFRVIGAVLPSGTTLAAPSASDLEELTQAIEEAGVPAIFADASQPDRLVQVLADEADVDVEVIALYTESLTPADGGAPTYLEMMRANERLLVSGLSPLIDDHHLGRNP